MASDLRSSNWMWGLVWVLGEGSGSSGIEYNAGMEIEVCVRARTEAVKRAILRDIVKVLVRERYYKSVC